MFALALPQGSWQTGGSLGRALRGCWTPARALWVLCHAVPCQPHLAVPAAHRGHCACDNTPSPSLRAPPQPKLPCQAVTRAVASLDAFAVSPGLEAAWKKAQCWEPGSLSQEKQPPFGGAFPVLDETNTARWRALCPPPQSRETEARPGAAQDQVEELTAAWFCLAEGREGRGAAAARGQQGHAAEEPPEGQGSLAALGGWQGPGHPAAGLGRWARGVGAREGARFEVGLLNPGWFGLKGCLVRGGEFSIQGGKVSAWREGCLVQRGTHSEERGCLV